MNSLIFYFAEEDNDVDLRCCPHCDLDWSASRNATRLNNLDVKPCFSQV